MSELWRGNRFKDKKRFQEKKTQTNKLEVLQSFSLSFFYCAMKTNVKRMYSDEIFITQTWVCCMIPTFTWIRVFSVLKRAFKNFSQEHLTSANLSRLLIRAFVFRFLYLFPAVRSSQIRKNTRNHQQIINGFQWWIHQIGNQDISCECS